MSQLPINTKWIERASDWANPILVKETRQALKSKQFVITFMLLLVASWLISVFGMLNAGDAIEYGSTGRTFFGMYYFVLATAVFFVVPFGAFRSLLTEREQNTFELLSITTLTPRQIVWGKLFSALVQVFIYYSAIAPFIAFTSLLQGFDVAQVAFVLIMSLLWALALAMLSLMLSTIGRQRQWQTMMSMVALLGLLFGLMMVFSVIGFALSQPIPFDDAEFWWGLGLSLTAGVSFLVLAQQITTAQLTFESDNRSTAIRVTCSVQFLLYWVGVFVYAFYGGGSFILSSPDERIVTACICAAYFSLVGLFVSNENDFLSRRIRRGLPKSRLVRLLISPLLPGGSRGLVYLLLHLTALWLIVVGTSYFRGTLNVWIWHFMTALCCYIVIYIGMGAALGRWGRLLSSEIRPAHVRVLTLLLLAAGVVAPYLPAALGIADWRPGYSLVYITNPFETLDQIQGSAGQNRIVTILLVGAAITLFLNSRSCMQGFIEIIRAQVRPRTAPTIMDVAEPLQSGTVQSGNVG